MRARLAGVGAILALAMATPSAHAAVVTMEGNSGGGTLRDVVAAATPGETITFGAAVNEITVTGLPIEITTSLLITDAQRDVVVRRTSGSGPVIEVGAGVSPVTLSGISFAGADRPIELVAGANGGVAPPGSLRATTGPTATGVSGSTTGPGDVEVLRGDPGSSAGALSVDRFAVAGGAFSRALPGTAPLGSIVAATFTAATGTSELATATVTNDTTAPFLLGAVAISQTQVRVQPSEPLAAATVAPGDFVLTMGGVQRAVTAAAPSADGSSITLTSNAPWSAGEAGFLRLAAPGAVTDVVGNPNASTDQVRVAAAPGDVLEPFASSLSLRPGSMCLTRNRRCRRPGMVVLFIASEPGRATFAVVRVNRRVGARSYDVKAGRNRIRFEGRIRGRKLRQGSYRLLVFLEDAVGNATQNPPVQRFSVRRTLAPRR